MECDVLLLADPRFPGGTSTALTAEARALAAVGYRVGFLPVASPILSMRRGPHPEIAALAAAGVLLPVPPDEPVAARLACIHHPAALLDWPAGVWRVRADEAVIVAHHPPVDATGAAQYDIARIRQVAADLFGAVPWAPVGPAARAAFAGLAGAPELTAEDWVNVLHPGDFAGPRSGPFSALAVVGRHSRPGAAKWLTRAASSWPPIPTRPTSACGF